MGQARRKGAQARTRTPQTLYVTDQATLDAPETQALAAKGHTIIAELKPLDVLVVGVQCRMVRAETIKYLGLAVKELDRKSVV